MIKILQVVSDLDINSGALMTVMNYYRHIDRNRIQFDFAYFYDEINSNETHKAEIHKLGGHCYHLGKPHISPSYFARLNTFFSTHKNEYAAVHCHPIWASEFIAISAKRSGIKHVIQHSHSTRLGNNHLSIIRNEVMLMWIGFFATDYAACSRNAARVLGKKNVKIFHNAIDYKKFAFNPNARDILRKQYEISDDKIVIGHVGRFTAEKNQRFLIDLFAYISKKNINNIVLMLVGDGELKEELQNECQRLKLTNVIFLGRRADVSDLLSAFDVFVLPSKYEGVPFAGLEAQAAGLGCVFSDTITREIETENTVYIPLNATFSKWLNVLIQETKCKKNRNERGAFLKSSYDIHKEAKKMEYYYCSLR